MNPRRSRLLIIITALIFALPEAQARLCDPSEEWCGWISGHSSTKPASPSASSSINLNPSSVPIEKGFGAEAIYFKNEFDFALVKGLGRVGAAISPSNSEETFFGPPGFELPEEYERRKTEQIKYPSQKLTLATAFGLLQNKRKGLRRFEVNLGVMGKYNRETKGAWPGAGLSGVAGPLTFGYSLYKDETLLDYGPYGLSQQSKVRYLVETYSIGLYLTSLALDYSVLRILTSDESTVSVLTASLIHRYGVLTLSGRTERSDRVAYNYETNSFESRRVKNEIFGGVQVNVTKSIMLGVFYNYYVLREVSLGATIFL